MPRPNVTLAILTAALAVTALTFTAARAAKAEKPPDTSVKGEVLDLACYISEGAKGPGHADCAKECAKGGQPMGLLGADGTVYLLLADHGDPAAFEKTKDLAGRKVEITGVPESRGALKGLTVHGVKALQE